MHRVPRRTASHRLPNQTQINGSHLRSWNLRDPITRGGFVYSLLYDSCTHFHAHRQHSYTTSLPQLSNSSPRGDYASYAIADTSSAQRSQVLPLFDLRQANMPHPTILVHLVQVFFECFSRNFPFLQYDDISRRMFNGTLSPLLANSIASLAARYSQSSDVISRGATAVSTTYADTAKVCLSHPHLKRDIADLPPAAPPARQLPCPVH